MGRYLTLLLLGGTGEELYLYENIEKSGNLFYNWLFHTSVKNVFLSKILNPLMNLTGSLLSPDNQGILNALRENQEFKVSQGKVRKFYWFKWWKDEKHLFRIAVLYENLIYIYLCLIITGFLSNSVQSL